MSNYERGIRKPDLEMLTRLADVYEVSVDYLLGRTNTFKFDFQFDKDENQIINDVLLLSDKSTSDLQKLLLVN